MVLNSAEIIPERRIGYNGPFSKWLSGRGDALVIARLPFWPHLNPIFHYFFIVFLTIIYKKPYKKQRFLIQFAKLDRFPPSTQNFSKNLFGHFRPFFTIISFFWPFQIVDLPQNINFHSTKNSRSPFSASKLHLFSPTSTTPFFQFCRFPDLRNSV